MTKYQSNPFRDQCILAQGSLSQVESTLPTVPTNFVALASKIPIRIDLLLLSLEDFFTVTEALMYFNCLTCDYLVFNFDGQNSENLLS